MNLAEYIIRSMIRALAFQAVRVIPPGLALVLIVVALVVALLIGR